MTFAFIFGVPMGIGAITVALSPINLAKNFIYMIFAPWVPILIFLLLALAFAFEGAICIIMAAPIFIVSSSLGGLAIGLARRSRISNKINVSFALLIPLVIIPIEKSFEFKPVTYEAVTNIIIEAPGDKIWDNVVRVREIKEQENNSGLSKTMGFPRPIKAELNYLGVGGNRKAVFDKNLIFDETVYLYEHQKKMAFSIKPLTELIPPEAMDEHIIVGGKYFTVLDGTYELLPAGGNKFDLILYSHFQMNTSFNFYSGWWAKVIMKDIQNNILNIIKKRSES